MSNVLPIGEHTKGPMCSYDEKSGVVIHRFDIGKCKCRCGERVVRKPVKRTRLKFGKEAEGWE
jgi:hypothetical protein